MSHDVKCISYCLRTVLQGTRSQQLKSRMQAIKHVWGLKAMSTVLGLLNVSHACGSRQEMCNVQLEIQIQILGEEFKVWGEYLRFFSIHMVIESKCQNIATKWSQFPIFIYIQFPEGWLCDFLDFQHLLKKNEEQSYLISRFHCLTLINNDLRTSNLLFQINLCTDRYSLNLTRPDSLFDRQRKTLKKRGASLPPDWIRTGLESGWVWGECKACTWGQSMRTGRLGGTENGTTEQGLSAQALCSYKSLLKPSSAIYQLCGLGEVS